MVWHPRLGMVSSRPESCQVHPAYDLPTVWRRRSQARALLGHRQGGAGRLAVLRDGALLKVASPPRDGRALPKGEQLVGCAAGGEPRPRQLHERPCDQRGLSTASARARPLVPCAHRAGGAPQQRREPPRLGHSPRDQPRAPGAPHLDPPEAPRLPPRRTHALAARAAGEGEARPDLHANDHSQEGRAEEERPEDEAAGRANDVQPADLLLERLVRALHLREPRRLAVGQPEAHGRRSSGPTAGVRVWHAQALTKSWP
mmetsp:Transcript_33809/g.79753  ORF Transcript_33809/g.79753 Transcript_33809/m.79753 type:complete len:258 (+) Transcript_33809:3-776(+)